MIEHMVAEAAPDWYAEACQRAAAHGRRRRRERAAAEVPAGWPEFGPPVGLAEGPLGAVQAADREIARQTALRARALAEFAASRPAEADRAQGEPGAMSPQRWAARPEVLRPVSEWATPELVVALSRGRVAAERLLEGSLILVERLPGVLAALEAAALHEGHLPALLEHVAPIEDPAVRGEVERVLLHWLADRAAARKVTTPGQLGEKVRREVLKRDARAAARRLERALRERGVYARRVGEPGTAELVATLAEPEVQALLAALGAYADSIDESQLPVEARRSRGQKMADCLLDLVLRPGETELPPVQVVLTLVASVPTALGGDEPGELGGRVVPAEMVRALLRAVGGLDAAACAQETEAADEPDPAAEPVSAEPVSAEPVSAEPVSAGPDAGEETAAPSGLEQAWQELYQRELGGWWAEIERRVLAGELGEGPDPIPAQVLAGWAAAAEQEHRFVAARDLLQSADGLDAEDLLGADGLAEAGDVCDPTGPPDRADLLDADRCSAVDGDGPFDGGGLFDGDTPPGEDPADPGDRPEAGWWAEADRAVERAWQARYAMQAALGHAGRLVRTAQRADAADEAAWRDSPAGRVDAARDALAALAAAAEADRQALAGLLARTAGGGLAERPRLALVDALSGALVSLTDLPELRRAAHCGRASCARRPEACEHDLSGRSGLGAPGPTDGYRPSAALERFLRARDRRCRFPGCRRPMATGELDHRVRWPDGPTAAGNLAGLCVGDHRGKHQAPGWTYDPEPGGTLTVTTPSGLTATTEPPPY